MPHKYMEGSAKYHPSRVEDVPHSKLPDPDERPLPPPYRLNPWTRFTTKVARGLDNALARHGARVARHPGIVAVSVVLIVLACTAGILRLKPTNDTDTLFSPRQSTSRDHKIIHERLYPDTGAQRNELHILTARNNQNILTKTHMLELLALHQAIESLSVDFGGSTYSYFDLCHRSTVNGVKRQFCDVSSPLSYWDFDPVAINNIASDQEVVTRVSTFPYRSRGGSILYRPSLLGGTTPPDVVTDPVTSAQAVMVIYTMSSGINDELGGPVEAWEKAFIARNSEFAALVPSFQYTFSTEISRNTELEESTSGDILLFIGTILLISLFCAAILGNFKDLVQGHVLLAQCALLTSFMSVGAAFGLCAAIGIPFVGFFSLLLFLITGIAVDDVVILIGELDTVDPLLPPEQRVRETLQHVGSSITLTNITSFLAFGVGASSVYPAITYFCIYAATAVLVLWCVTVTFFVAMMAIECRRMHGGRRDIIPCLAPPNHYTPGPNPEQGKLFKRVVRTYVTPVLLKKPVKIIVILVTVGWFAFSLWGTTQVRQGLDVRDLFSRDSYLIPFLEARNSYFVVPTPVSVLCEGKPFHQLERQQQMLELADLAASFNETVQVDMWYPVMLSWVAATTPTLLVAFPPSTTPSLIPSDQFNTVVQSFLASELGRGYQPDLLFDPSSGDLNAFRFLVRTRGVPFAESSRNNKNMVGLRDAMAPSPLQPKDWFQQYIFYEGDRLVVQITLVNLASVLLAVMVVCMVLLVSPTTTAFVILAIIMIDIDLFGLMYLWDVSLDTIAMINLVMAVGFSVDFSSHTAHAFMSALGTRDERAAFALSEMGVSVWYGGLSTFLGMLLLAFAKSTAFRIFFKMFFGIVLFGLYHGLIFLPVLLSIIGPRSYAAGFSDVRKVMPSTLDTSVVQADDGGNPTTPQAELETGMAKAEAAVVSQGGGIGRTSVTHVEAWDGTSESTQVSRQSSAVHLNRVSSTS